jgi:hypothetical protein
MREHWLKMDQLLTKAMRPFLEEGGRITAYLPSWIWLLLARWALRSYKISGSVGPPPALFKHRVIKEYARRCSTPVFVETGTYLGHTVRAMIPEFDQIVSIELDRRLCARAKRRFQNVAKVRILCGDSGEVLARLLPTIKQRCLFWLDAHFSGGPTAMGDLETPIIKELNRILSRKITGDVILVDDARCFTGEHDYPTIGELRDLVWEKEGRATFEVEYDIIRIITR